MEYSKYYYNVNVKLSVNGFIILSIVSMAWDPNRYNYFTKVLRISIYNSYLSNNILCYSKFYLMTNLSHGVSGVIILPRC